MKTKSNKKFNLLMIGFLAVVLIALAIFFGACNKEDYFNKYGRANAFMKSASTGNALHLDTNNVDFYIDPSVTGSYLTGVKHAIAQANSATNSLTVTGNGARYSDFTFRVVWDGYQEGNESALGLCHINGFSDGEIYRADIRLFDDNFKWYGYWFTSHKKHTALHELGHALGLAHVDSLPSGNTVMESNASLFNVTTSFTEFDLANLQWMYDQGGRNQY